MGRHKQEKLHDKQKAVIELLASGIDQKQVAEQIGVDPATISRWRRLDMFSEELDKTIKANFRSFVPKGLRVLIQLLDSRNEQIKLKAATELLDRGGYKAIDLQKIEFTGEMTNKNVDLSSFSIEELKNLATLEGEVEPGSKNTH